MTEQEAIKEFEERLEIEDYRDNIPKYYEAMELAVKDMEEIQQYRAIGTLEDCRAALGKQKAKKPNKCIGFTESLFVCPTCGRKQPIMYEQHYCKECGQKLDWSGKDDD